MEQHLLVCVSASPSNQKVIRAAADLAAALGARITGLYVETPADRQMTEEIKRNLEANRKEAEERIGKVVCVSGDDVGFQIAEYVRKTGVTKIIMGRSSMKQERFHTSDLIVDRIMELRPETDIFIIPDGTREWYAKRHLHLEPGGRIRWKAPAVFAAALAAATAAGSVLTAAGIGNAGIISVYMGAVFTASLITGSIFSTWISLLAAVALFDFFFMKPVYSLAVYGMSGTAELMIFAVCLGGASAVALHVKHRACISAQTAYRAKMILEANQLFRQAESRQEVIRDAAEMLIRLFGKTVVFYPVKGNGLDEPEVYFGRDFDGDTKEEYLTGNEAAAAGRVLVSGRRAGATTDIIPEAECLYLAARGSQDILGVAGIALKKESLSVFEINLAVSVLGECALALERLDRGQDGLL